MSARARWSAFLQQIGERHAVVCAEAIEGAREALVAAGYDPSPIGQAMSAVGSRLSDLERRIIDTWNEKVEPTYEAEGIPHDVAMADRARGEELAWNLENAREAATQKIHADAARTIYAHALQGQRDRLCPTCGAPLDIPLVARAINVTCARCRAIATFEPGMAMRTALAIGAHALSWEAAYPQWLAMRVAERRVKSVRPPAPVALLKEHERAQIAYWWSYFQTRGHLEPEVRDVAREVRARMDAWYTYSAEHEEAWRAAGRPREVF